MEKPPAEIEKEPVKSKRKITEEKKAFFRGFTCACACALREHGCNAIIEDVYQNNFLTVAELKKYDVDEFDISLLRPIIKEINRKKKNKI